MSDDGPTGSSELIQETGPTGSSELIQETGPTGSSELIQDTGPISLDSLTGGAPPPPLILLSDILTDISVLQGQEASDRAKLDAIAHPNLSIFRSQLVPWVAGGCQGSCDLIRVGLSPPNVCSDGVSRNLFDYIHFLSGTSLPDSLASIRAILPDFEVGYRCSRTEIVICAIRVLTAS